MHTLVMDLEPGYLGIEPGFLYRFNRDLWQTITSSHLTLQTKPGKIKNFKLSGVTRQETTEGNQLIPYPYYTADGTYRGITAQTTNGHIRISGTTTKGCNYVIYNNIPAGTYGVKIRGNHTGMDLFVYDFNASKILCSIYSSTQDGSAIFTLAEGIRNQLYFNQGAEGKTVDIDVDIIMTTADKIDTAPWEPYTGATSSPSPEYPQDVQGVGVRTAQMLDFTKDITYSGCTLMDADTGTIKCDIINDYYCRLKITYLNDYIMAHKGDNLIFYADQPLDTWITIIIWGTRSSGETYQEINGNGKVVKATIADDFASIKILELRLNRKNATFTDTETVIPNLMLYEGSTVKPYEPYGYRTDVVTRSKNLLDQQRMLDFILQKPGASIVQFDGRRCLKLDGGFNFPDFNLYEGFEPEKRYTLTYDGFYEKYKTEAYLGNGFAFTLQNGGRNLSLMDVSDIGTWKHKTTTSDTGVTKLTFTYGTHGVVYIDLDTIQVEEGSTPTPYQPYAYYTAPIYTQSPVYAGDQLQLVDGQYCHVQNSMTVEGASVKWLGRPSDVTSFDDSYYSYAIVPGASSVQGYSDIKSTHFPKNETIKTANVNGAFLYDGMLRSRLLGVTTLDAFKAWMTEHNPQFLLPRAEPQTEPLPAISQQALRNLPTYKGTTIIDTTDPLEPEITVSYSAQKKNFFNPEKVFSSRVTEATGYYKFDLGLSPGNYRWTLQRNDFLGSKMYIVFTDNISFDGTAEGEGKFMSWIGHSSESSLCRLSGTLIVKDNAYLACGGPSWSISASKQLLATMNIEKV